MTYEEITEKVRDGAKFTIDFKHRTMKLDRKLVDLSDCKFTPCEQQCGVMDRIETLYEAYKHSIPSKYSESHYRSYFKALPERDLSDEDMMYGSRRESARLKLELYILLCLIDGQLTWDNEWGSWFWQSPNDKDLIILREWIEPNKDGE